MKKFFFAMVAIAAIAFTGCSKNDNNSFDYDLNSLYGRWRVTNVMSNGVYVDVTTAVGQSVFEPTYITFNSDGSYYGEGFFGTGSGTYKATGKTIITYVDGEEYLRYNILSMSGTNAEIEMYEKSAPSDKIQIKVAKQ